MSPYFLSSSISKWYFIIVFTAASNDCDSGSANLVFFIFFRVVIIEITSEPVYFTVPWYLSVFTYTISDNTQSFLVFSMGVNRGTTLICYSSHYTEVFRSVWPKSNDILGKKNKQGNKKQGWGKWDLRVLNLPWHAESITDTRRNHRPLHEDISPKIGGQVDGWRSSRIMHALFNIRCRPRTSKCVIPSGWTRWPQAWYEDENHCNHWCDCRLPGCQWRCSSVWCLLTSILWKHRVHKAH